MLPWYTAEASDGERFWICADCSERDLPPLPELLWDSLEGEEMPGGELTYLGKLLYAIGSCGMLIPDYMRRRREIVEGEPEGRGDEFW